MTYMDICSFCSEGRVDDIYGGVPTICLQCNGTSFDRIVQTLVLNGNVIGLTANGSLVNVIIEAGEYHVTYIPLKRVVLPE